MFKFKKVASVLATSALLGTTVLTAMTTAAMFPEPFVTGGSGNVAIVWGSNPATAVTDYAAAVNIMERLNSEVVVGSVTPSTSVSGEAISLNSGSEYVYLNDELNENVQSITSSELPTILADGTFTDDNGNDFDYEQTITVSSGATFAFSNSDNDLDDPALLISLPTTSGYIYNSTVTFDEAVAFNATASEGEEITLFGKKYTVGTATDGDTLILLGGSDTTTIEIGETTSVEIGEGENAESYDVTLNGISDATTPSASITVNGETKTFTEGQTKSFADGDVDVFVKTVFRTGDNVGHVEVQIGANKLTLENTKKVKVGADEENVDGTYVTITGGVSAMTKLVIAISAEDNDNNHLLVGDMIMDPVFGSFDLKFQAVQNGPMITDKEDTSTTRNMLSIEKGGNRELLLSAVDASGNDAGDLPFAYNNDTTDDNSKRIHLVEGATMAEDEYTVLNSGDKQFFVQLTDVSFTSGGATDDEVEFTDLFTGTTYNKEGNFSGSGQTLNMGGQTFTIIQTSGSTTTLSIRSSDFSSNLAVFPYMELVSGEDHRFAITDYVTAFDDATAASNKTIELPTGSGTVTFADLAGGDCTVSITPSGGSATNIVANRTLGAAEDTVTFGTVDYVFWANETGTDNDACTAVDLLVSLENTQSSTGDVQYDAPVLLFVEDEDKSETTTTTKNAIVLKTSDAGTYTTVSTPLFTGTSDNQAFDDTDFTGYLTNFGTYVLVDSSDDNQDFASLTYPKTPMYADVYFAESDAVITGGSGGGNGQTVGIPILDSEADGAAAKNWIVVGGSCVNSVAADLLDVSYPTCGADWTTNTNVGTGQYLIQTFDRTSGKVATLVAGFNAADTTNAATYLRTQDDVDTTAGKKYIGTTSSSASLVTETA